MRKTVAEMALALCSVSWFEVNINLILTKSKTCGSHCNANINKKTKH